MESANLTEKDKDIEMKDEGQNAKNKNGDAKDKNGGPKKFELFRESDEDDDEHQVMETDEFGKLHRELCKKTRKDIERERSHILGFLDELKEDMVN